MPLSAEKTVSDRIRRRASEEFAKWLRVRPVVARNVRPLISFTFDDVPESAFVNGAAILQDRGIRGTFYISGGLVGTTGECFNYITHEQCKALNRGGHEIGCHTFSHPNLRTIGSDRLTHELSSNRAFFKTLDGIELDNFAFPYGATSLARRSELQPSFRSCRSTQPGVNSSKIDVGYLRGVELCHGRMSLRLAKDWIDQAQRENGWLIFITHDVVDTPSPWGCTPPFFKEIVSMAAASGCDVLTVRDALDRAAVVRKQEVAL
jgi:peptidoglycan/xylan/chitin deacetylase (PgdA/CDA1 family)